jgi:hypothetical protein
MHHSVCTTTQESSNERKWNLRWLGCDAGELSKGDVGLQLSFILVGSAAVCWARAVDSDEDFRGSELHRC